MRNILIVTSVIATMALPAHAQSIGPPSGQGSSPSPQGSQSPPSLPSTANGNAFLPGSSEYQRLTPLPPERDGRRPSFNEDQGRELPEQPERPLR
jgi:hypothetical protein